MIVVSGIGRTYKPVFFFPAREFHYRVVADDLQTALDWLPHCYFYQRDVVGVDSLIFNDWAKQFVEEKKEFRINGHHTLLVMDSYAADTRFSTLNYLKDNLFFCH